MKLFRLIVSAALACLLVPTLALAQSQPVSQSGTLAGTNSAAHSLAKFWRDGSIGGAGNTLGDKLGRGVTPFAVEDGNAPGTCWNTDQTGNPYNAFCIGHDANGNPTLNWASSGGLATKQLIVQADGTTIIVATGAGVALAGAPTATTPANGDNSNRIATTAWTKALVDTVSTVPAPIGDVRKLTSAAVTDTLLSTDLAVHWANPNRSAAATETLPACPGLNGYLRWVSDDVGLAGFYPITMSPASGTINGKSSFSLNWAYGAVALQCDGVGNYAVRAPPTPTATTLSAVSAVDVNPSLTIISKGLGNAPQQLPLSVLLGHGGNLHFFVNNSGVPQPVDSDWWGDEIQALGSGNIILDVSMIDFNRPYHFETDTVANLYLDGGSASYFQGMTQVGMRGQLLRISPGQTVTLRRASKGLYYVSGTNSLPSVMPFAELPTPAGGSPVTIFCSNCRKVGEGGGAGTGTPVYFNPNTQTWYRASDDTLGAI